MATDKQVIEEFLEGLWEVRVHSMMGEYVVYCREKAVGSVCDNMLYVKITPASVSMLTPLAVPRIPPYVGAKPCFQIQIAEMRKEFIQQLLIAVSNEILPKKKR